MDEDPRMRGFETTLRWAYTFCAKANPDVPKYKIVNLKS